MIIIIVIIISIIIIIITVMSIMLLVCVLLTVMKEALTNEIGTPPTPTRAPDDQLRQMKD